MSFGRLHENQSGYAVTQHLGSRSPPLRKATLPESEGDDSGIENCDAFRAQQGYELKNLNLPERTDQSEADADFEKSDSDDGNGFSFNKPRTGSTSTAQSFKLYTPDEERTVKRKFDRRLVLFVAFLYMLSFLDRSSTYPSLPILRGFSFGLLHCKVGSVSPVPAFRQIGLACRYAPLEAASLLVSDVITLSLLACSLVLDSAVLTFSPRYWKCQNCWNGERSSSEFLPIRMAPKSLLHHVHCV